MDTSEHPPAAETVEIQGRTLTMPVRFRDARLRAAVFLGRSAPLRDLLGEHGLRPVSLLGRCPVVVLSVAYTVSDLDAYDEVGVMVPARGPGGRLGPHTLQLPVTQSFTMEAGQRLWGLPKWLADIDLDHQGAHVAVDGAHVLSAIIRTPRLRLPGTLEVPAESWGIRKGRLLWTRARLTLGGVRLGLGGAEVLPGAGHPLAQLLVDLGFPRRALLRATVDRFSAAIDAAEEL